MQGEMRILDKSGDLKIMWNSDVADEVAHARATFEDYTKNKRYFAYKVKKDGSTGEKITAFDPDVEMMILQPQNVGG